MTSSLSDIGSERAVLAGLFQYGIDAYVELSDIIDHNTFVHSNNQILYKCVIKAISTNVEVDLPSILSAATQLKVAEIVNSEQELQYIKSLFDFPVKKDNVITFAVQLKKFELARKIKSLVGKISREAETVTGTESVDEILSMVETPVMDFLR